MIFYDNFQTTDDVHNSSVQRRTRRTFVATCKFYANYEPLLFGGALFCFEKLWKNTENVNRSINGTRMGRTRADTNSSTRWQHRHSGTRPFEAGGGRRKKHEEHVSLCEFASVHAHIRWKCRYSMSARWLCGRPLWFISECKFRTLLWHGTDIWNK